MKITGHNKKIKGKLLNQYFDDRNEIGFAYERSISYFADLHSHDWHMFVFPRPSSEIYFNIPKENKNVTVNENKFMWMPGNTEHSQGANTLIWDNFALYVSDKHFKSIINAQGLSKKQETKLLTTTMVLKRNDFINQLINELFLQKILKEADYSNIESIVNIVIEQSFFSLTKTKNTLKGRKMILSQIGQGTIASMAIDFIEQNLFTNFRTEDLTKYCGTSPATLFRHFSKEYQLTPFDYLKTRRLEEAKGLLKRSDYTTEEICYLVGYNDYSAFSRSFKNHFKVNPSDIRK